MPPAISIYYHHLEYFWVISACDPGFAIWITSRWKCTNVVVNGHFVCVGCHDVWSRWKSALMKTRNQPLFLRPNMILIFTHFWTKPCFLTNNIHVVVTSWNIFQHLNKQIATNFRWILGSVALDHWADFFPIDGLRDFLFTFTFQHCILKQISLFWMGNLCTRKSDSSFLRVLSGTQNNVNVLFVFLFQWIECKKGRGPFAPFHSSVENAWSFKRLSCPTIPSKVVIDEILRTPQTDNLQGICKD